jgi:hypothetical protein
MRRSRVYNSTVCRGNRRPVERETMTKIIGYRIKDGKVIKAARKQSVSQKIQARKKPKTKYGKAARYGTMGK